jgi:hypothetical protein
MSPYAKSLRQKIPKLRRNFWYWPALSIAEARIQHRDMHSRLERLMSIKDIHR